MKILYCTTFGIGNTVMAIPAIRALKSMGHDLDVLVGTMPDDGGALEVMLKLRDIWMTVDNVYNDRVDTDRKYDLAILSIPYDGRWHNGIHFKADRIMDGRTRPDPSTTGLVSWKKHEIEYQMDNARDLGYVGPTADTSFLLPLELGRVFRPRADARKFYFGLGYKKDAAGFWKKKHWGNENFAELAKLILASNPGNQVVMTGDAMDFQLSIAPVIRMVNSVRVIYQQGALLKSFDVLSGCDVYVGNDTGMMHVAASLRLPTYGLFFLENSIVKSRPWGENCHAIDGVGRSVSPQEVFERIS